MALDFKKMSFGQLAGIGAGLFVVVMVIAGFVISSTSKPPQKVATKRPVQFEAPAADSVEIGQLRNELQQLKARVDANAQAAQEAFAKTAAAVDQQNANLSTMGSNFQQAENRIGQLEKQRMGTRVQIIKPEDQHARPRRSERIAAAPANVHAARPMQLSGQGDYRVQAAVGNRAWIRNGDEEISVREGEVIPLQGQLVVKRVTSGGQVSVDVENAH